MSSAEKRVSLCILRASDLYGSGLPWAGLQFALVRDGSIHVLKDQVIAPTWTLDLARAVSSLVSHKARGIFHFNLQGSVSPRMFLEKAFELESARGRGSGPAIVEQTGEEFLAAADRPRYNVLDPAKFCRTFGPVRDWESALKDYISAGE
jgi:dTDP-4-dehydrorhamnose reductase